jgi:hypothetical protein
MAGGGREIRSVSNPSNLADFLQLLQTIDQDRSQPGVSVKGTDVRNPEIPESRVDPKRRCSGFCDESYDEEGEVNPLLLEVRREDVNVEDSGAWFPDTLNCSRIYEDPEEGSDALVQHYSCGDTSRGGSVLQEYDHSSNTERGDARSVSVQELRAKVREAVGLCEDEKERLFDMLLKYKDSFTTRPGKCSLMKYRFDVTSPEPIVGGSRPIPFSVRAEVRAQINQMLQDGIIELSNSAYLSPLTIVLREGKFPLTCIDVRRVNKWKVPDRTKVQPIAELLRRFHGSRYISSIDLSSAFLQVELER